MSYLVGLGKDGTQAAGLEVVQTEGAHEGRGFTITSLEIGL